MTALEFVQFRKLARGAGSRSKQVYVRKESKRDEHDRCEHPDGQPKIEYAVRKLLFFRWRVSHNPILPIAQSPSQLCWISIVSLAAPNDLIGVK
jgi:hypothetical protein